MDYEQKYKEALQKIRELIERGKENGWTIISYEKDFEEIFPELEEGKDERILEIIKHCIESRYLHTSTIKGISQKQCFAWLEKQGDTIPDECVFRPVAGCNIESAAKQAIKQQGVLAKEVVLAFNGAYIPVGGKAADIIVNEYNSWLEKQGKNLVKNGYTNNKDIIKYADNYSHEIWHKLMDNFKNIKDYYIGCNDVSDIVLNAIIDTYNWLEKQGETYTERDVDNAYVVGMAFAKDELEKQSEQNLANSAKTCKKSQRMISAEAKEALWPDKYEGLTDFERTLADVCIGWIGEELGWKQYIKDNADVLLKIAIKKFNSVQEKPTWSEEDEKNLQGIIDEIQANKSSAPSYDINVYDRYLSWLKSLKQKIGG